MLRKGQTFPASGQVWCVVYVTAWRAHCRATSRKVVTVTDKKGKVRTFNALSTDTLDVSPNTEPSLLTELAQKGHL